jgi:predicted Rossmann fold nucleotide-binding protein DprA/Smf involved in DNA uptake
MKIAIVGSRTICEVSLDGFVFAGDEIVSGGAVGVDRCAAQYAREHGLSLTEFLPNYKDYGRAAPIVRNKSIVDYANKVIVFWDGSSRGALSVIKYAKKVGKPCEVIVCEMNNE